MEAINELKKSLASFCVGEDVIETMTRTHYDVYDHNDYTYRGVSHVVIDIDVSCNPWTGEEEATGCIIEYDDKLERHGRSYSVIATEFGLYVTYVSHYVNGKEHNATGFARHTTDVANNHYSGYYLNGVKVTKDTLEVKQRAAITELLPQPIWEEILEHYAIEV